jgi:hypothetical protein
LSWHYGGGWDDGREKEVTSHWLVSSRLKV